MYLGSKVILEKQRTQLLMMEVSTWNLTKKSKQEQEWKNSTKFFLVMYIFPWPSANKSRTGNLTWTYTLTQYWALKKVVSSVRKKLECK